MELEELVQLIDDDVLQQGEVPALFGGQLQETGEDGGHLDDGEVLLRLFAVLLALFRLEVHGDVQRLVGQLGEGPAAVHRQGGEHGEEDALEVLGDELQLLGGHLLAGDKADAVAGQHRGDGTVQAGVLLLHELVGLLLQQGQQLLGGEVEVVLHFVVGVDLGLHPGHPDHEELVQVRAGDGQKPQALHQGVFLFGRLLQHSGVKVHPAQFSVVVGHFFIRHVRPSFLYTYRADRWWRL